MSGEANFSVTVKVGQKNDLLTVRGDSVEEFTANLISLGDSGIGALVANLVEMANATHLVGDQLGGQPVDLPTTQPAPSAQRPQPPANPVAQQQAEVPPEEPKPWGEQPSAAAAGGGDWRNDPSIQPPHLTPPETPFGFAEYYGGVSQKTGRPYRMWRDPRPYRDIRDLPEVPLAVLNNNPQAGRMQSQFIDDKALNV